MTDTLLQLAERRVRHTAKVLTKLRWREVAPARYERAMRAYKAALKARAAQGGEQ